MGVTDATFELIRSFYVPYEDGTDDVTPVIARAMRYIDEDDRTLPAPERPELEAAPPDHLADIADTMRGELRVRTQVVLARLAAHNPTIYEGWTLTDLRDVLAEYGVTPGKSHGVMVVRADDITTALTGETDGEDAGRRGELPNQSLQPAPPDCQRKRPSGSLPDTCQQTPETPRNRSARSERTASLPDPHPDRTRGDSG